MTDNIDNPVVKALEYIINEGPHGDECTDTVISIFPIAIEQAKKAEAFNNLATFLDITNGPNGTYVSCGFNLNSSAVSPSLRQMIEKQK